MKKNKKVYVTILVAVRAIAVREIDTNCVSVCN